MNSYERFQRALLPARSEAGRSTPQTHRPGGLRLLIVDLNNFASFPTFAIGLLVAALRQRGHRVEVLCPPGT